MPTRKIDEDFELWALMHQTTHTMERARENEIRQFGITMMQAAVLWGVKSVEAPATPSKIARRLLRKPNTVSGLLDRMEKQGLVKRVKDPNQKTSMRLELTDVGEEARRRSRREMKVIRRILSSLSPEERKNLATILHKLRNTSLQELAIMEEGPFT